jgi:hypothetical protein
MCRWIVWSSLHCTTSLHCATSLHCTSSLHCIMQCVVKHATERV